MPMGNGAPFPEEIGTQVSQEQQTEEVTGKRTAAQIAAINKPVGTGNDLANRTEQWHVTARQANVLAGGSYNVTKVGR